MKIDEAVSILRAHNEWRRAPAHLPDDAMPAMGDPRLIGVAIDTVCDALSKSGDWARRPRDAKAKQGGQVMNGIVAEAAGWPLWLVHLSDLLSEGLPAGEREQFHADLRQAVPAGVDLDPVQYHIAIARHERSIARLAGNTAPYAQQCIAALKGAIDWCRAEISGTSIEELRSAARSAARSAEESATAAAWSAEELAAWSAAISALWSARSAARSADESTAISALWSARSAGWSARWAARSADRSAMAAWSAEWSAVHAEYRAERDALLSALRNMQRTSGGDA